ncbi:MAG: glycosyltransferase family 2 protein, partial [Duncaniella sp.]|nr:glycosyltransferase family 2 protein [Duncaniella sp.]
MPRLSIIILTHNQKDITLYCLRTLHQFAEHDSDVEIIIVDNGSIDNTQEEITAQFNNIRYIKRDKNIGVARGRNIGIKASTGKYILLLDNDTTPSVKAINDLVEILDQSSDIGILAPRLISPKGETQTSYKKFPGILEKLKNLLGRKQTDIEYPTTPIEPFYVIGACQLFRRELIEQIGLLDENIFFGPEDADFCIRVRNAGYKIVYYPDISIIHDWQRASSRNIFSKISIMHLKALIYFYIKHNR